MKVLVTGASGFVGRSLCAQLVARGWGTWGLSRSHAPHGQWIQADLSRPFSWDQSVDVVVHAAARSSPWGTRREFEAQNVDATRHLIEFCQGKGQPHLIYISTSAVLYRNEHQYEMSEATPPSDHFLNDYARTKFLGEELVRAYPGPWTILRPRAVFGPGDTVVFPRILRAAEKGKFPIIESGATVMADLIYIDTLVEYIIRTMERRAQGLFHLSNHEPVPVVAFLTTLFARLGLPAPKKRLSVRKAMLVARVIERVYRVLPFLGEPPITRFGASVFAYSKTMDVSKALRELGPPAVSIDEGVDRFVRWCQRTE